MGTSNFNSYVLGCITVLTTKYYFWLSKLVSLQKMVLLEHLFANWTMKIFYTIKEKKKPFSLQDASDITIEKCLLLHCSNIGVRQTHFTLSVFLTSHLLLTGTSNQSEFTHWLDFVLHHSSMPQSALYVYSWKITATAWRDQKANKNPQKGGQSQHQNSLSVFITYMILFIKLLLCGIGPNKQVSDIWFEKYFIRRQNERLGYLLIW